MKCACPATSFLALSKHEFYAVTAISQKYASPPFPLPPNDPHPAAPTYRVSVEAEVEVCTLFG